MAVQANPQLKSGATDDLAIDGAGTTQVALRSFDRTGPILNANSTPPVTKNAADTLAMSGGAATLDLTAISYNGTTVDLTGLKVQSLLVRNDNDNAITISDGASNGYALNGGNDIVIPAGSVHQFTWNETLGDVGASAKNLDISGTGTDALKFVISAG